MKVRRPRKKSRFKCINEDFIETDPMMTQELILEQWRVYVKSAEAISERRQQFINWFNAVNGLIVASFAGILKFVHLDGLTHSILWLRFFPPILGVVLSATALFRIFVYRERKKDKYSQIYILEHFLPFKLYTNEYKMRKRRKIMLFNINLNSGTRLEMLPPLAFLVIYIAMIIWSAFTL